MNTLITVFTVVATACAVGTLLFIAADAFLAIYERKKSKRGDISKAGASPIEKNAPETVKMLDENALNAVKELNERLSEIIGERVDGNVSVQTLSQSEAEALNIKGDTVIIING